MAVTRVTIGGWRQETGTNSRVTIDGWRQETAAAAVSVIVAVGSASFTGYSAVVQWTDSKTAGPAAGLATFAGHTPSATTVTAGTISRAADETWWINHAATRAVGSFGWVQQAQHLRPESTYANTNWIGSPDNSNLYANIDETDPDGGDFVYTITQGATYEFTLTTGDAAAGDVIWYHAKSQSGNSLKIGIYSAGGSLIQEWTDAPTATVSRYSHTLTSAGTGPIRVLLTAV